MAAFSDGVFAVIITTMVLDLRPPEHPTFAAILPLWPTAPSRHCLDEKLGGCFRIARDTPAIRAFGVTGGPAEVAVGTIIADRPPHRSVRALISAYGSYLG